jgi:hypothetical protein
MIFTPRGQLYPWRSKFDPRGEIKNRPHGGLQGDSLLDRGPKNEEMKAKFFGDISLNFLTNNKPQSPKKG